MKKVHTLLTMVGLLIWAGLLTAQMTINTNSQPSQISSPFVIGSTTVTETDLAKITGITNGSAAASKALVTNSSNNISGVNGYTAVDFISGGRFVFAAGGSASGSADTEQSVLNVITGVANNTATAVLTFTVPNTAQAAVAQINLFGSLGSGGAVGANEATGAISYNLSITRTAAVDTVATLSTAYGSATSAVSGATTITVTGAVSSMTGASNATQTFTLNITIARGGGSSTNHTAKAMIRLLNANGSGVTVT